MFSEHTPILIPVGIAAPPPWHRAICSGFLQVFISQNKRFAVFLVSFSFFGLSARLELWSIATEMPDRTSLSSFYRTEWPSGKTGSGP